MGPCCYGSSCLLLIQDAQSNNFIVVVNIKATVGSKLLASKYSVLIVNYFIVSLHIILFMPRHHFKISK